MTDTAVLHDQFHTYGGAERVAVAIARELDAPIYVMAGDESNAPDDVEIRQLAGRVGQWCMRRHPLVKDGYQMLAWQHQADLYEYDVVVETKTNPYWFVPQDTQTVIRYTHSTPRQIYDQWHRRYGGLMDSVKGLLQRGMFQHALPYADAWLANSDLVAHRMKKYFGLDEDAVEVVYPPVDTKSFSPDLAETGDYLFTVGRLAINKRLDLLVDVAREIDRPVKIAGDGPLRDKYESSAPANVEFLGYISEEEKARRLSEARATLFLAENEDFGIVPIESMASGTPVIGVDEGFTRHQIINGANGLLCEPTVEGVCQSVADLDELRLDWDEATIEGWADRWFSADRFGDELRRVVERTIEDSRITPMCGEPDIDGVELTMEAIDGD